MSAGLHRPAPSLQRIVLTGFMGAGKSTVGRILAARLGWRFYDIDHLITAQQHLSIDAIFAQHGEARFRELEAQAVRTRLAETHSVIALGGGAIETPAVRDLLFPAPASEAPATLTIYLEAPLTELLERCTGHAHAAVRPLLQSAESPEARLTRRLPHYQRAHLTIRTSGSTPEAVVDRILHSLPAHPGNPRTDGAAS